MKSICFYFQVHQPFRLRTYRFFDIGKNHYYYDEYINRMIMRRVAEKCYLPMNALLLEQIKEYGVQFKVSFSISGIAMEQMEMYAPEVLESFKKLVATGNVEILAETYGHSLSSLKNPDEFKYQVELHTKKVQELFGVTPTSFRNTELIYSDKIGELVANMGFKVMLTEGAKHVLGWKSPNYMYTNAINPKLKVLLRNFRLSDDISFRFGQQGWSEWPVTATKFVGWLNKINPKEEVINIFLDYETFGEHQWAATGIFDFMKELPKAIFAKSKFVYSTPSELAKTLQPVSAIHVPNTISWADEERDLTAWLGNNLQDEAFDKLYSLADRIRLSDDERLKQDWLYLQSSDHFYYMCTKWFSDGDVHRYFNHYPSPYEAYINYMNVLADFVIRLNASVPESKDIMNEFVENATQFGKELGKLASSRIKSVAKDVAEAVQRGEDKIKPVFEDIKKLKDSKVKQLVKELDAEQLVIALKDAEAELVEKVLPNLNKITREKYDEIASSIGKVSKAEVKKVRSQIENQLKKLF
jgi:alpha-amylase